LDHHGTLIDYNALDSRTRWTIAWSFLWRNIVTNLAALVAVLVSARILGPILAVAGLGVGVIRLVGALLGLGLGAVALMFYVSWLFDSRLGKYRLRLVRDNDLAV
jgi:hypothetical protein